GIASDLSGRPLRAVSNLGRVVVREQAVEALACSAENLLRRGELLLRAGVRHLARRGHHLEDEVATGDEIVVGALGCFLPRQRAAAALGLGATLVGELVDALPVGLGRAHEALVGQLLERRVHASGARRPRALAALGDLADDLVAMHRLVCEEGDDGGADVAAPCSAPAEWPGAEHPPVLGPTPAAVATPAAHEKHLVAGSAARPIDRECGHVASFRFVSTRITIYRDTTSCQTPRRRSPPRYAAARRASRVTSTHTSTSA